MNRNHASQLLLDGNPLPGCDHTLKAWDVEAGEVLATFTCDGAVRCCSMADDRKLIVAGDTGGRVHLLRLEEPQPED